MMKIALLGRGVDVLPIAGRAVDDLDRQVGKMGPLAGPLGLQRSRRNDQAAADPAGTPEDIAAGDCLGGLTQPHVVGQQELTGLEEPLDPVALVGVERALQSLQHGFLLGRPERLLDDSLELVALVDEQGARAGSCRKPFERAGTTLSKDSTSSRRRTGSS